MLLHGGVGPPDMRLVGVDLSARRGLDVAGLHAARGVLGLCHAPTRARPGGRPPRKTTREGMAVRIEALRRAGLRDVPEAGLTHDAVDALCAAFTAWAWHHGLGCALGRPDEGLMVLPVPADALKERYGS